MARPSGLLKVGSIADAMGVYVTAMALQKGLGLGRIWLFAYLMREATDQYVLWGVGMMLFTLVGRLLSLGANQGVARYVSYYEARGRLEEFYRRIRVGLVALIAVTVILAFVARNPVVRYVIASRGEGLPAGGYRYIYIAALLNAAAMALYHCLLAFMSGMRTYRLLSAMEVLFSVLLTALGIGALMIERSAMAVLAAHLAAVCICMLIGGLLLHRAVTRSTGRQAPGELRIGNGSDADAAGPFARVLRFGSFAMIATLVWSVAQYVGFHITQRYYGKAAAAPFLLMMQLSQPVLFIANAAWAVLFSHAARHWEHGDREGAIFRLETAYKAVAIGTMTLTVALYATSDLWMRLMPLEYRGGQALLVGLLLLFQAMTQLSILTMIAKLHERPLVIAAVAAGAVGLNVILAMRWMGDGGIADIALAGGIGMYAGGGVVAAAYMLISRAKLHASTYLVLTLPVMLMLPVRIMLAAWAGLLVAAIVTPLFFDSRQKGVIALAVTRLAHNLRRTVS